MNRFRTIPKASTTARGYGWTHKQERNRWEQQLRLAGALPCAELRHVPHCPGVIVNGQPFELAHNDARTGYLGIAFPACNRTAGARKGALVANAKRMTRVTQLTW